MAVHARSSWWATAAGWNGANKEVRRVCAVCTNVAVRYRTGEQLDEHVRGVAWLNRAFSDVNEVCVNVADGLGAIEE